MASIIPGSGKLPEWIRECVPEELAVSTLFRFQVTLQVEEATAEGERKRKKIIVDLLPDLNLDYEILEEQLQSLPAQYAFFSAVYSEVRLNAATVERAMKALRGTIVKNVLKEAADNKVKLNQDQVKLVIESDSKLGKLDEHYQRLQMQTGKLYHMLEALKMKAELARSLAGFKRQDRETHS